MLTLPPPPHPLPRPLPCPHPFSRLTRTRHCLPQTKLVGGVRGPKAGSKYICLMVRAVGLGLKITNLEHN